MAIARILPIVSADPSLPQLDYAALTEAGVHVPEFIDPGLTEDYLFDLTADVTYRNRLSTGALEPSGMTGSLVSDGIGKYLRIDAGGLNGLPLALTDRREWTYGGIFRYQTPLVVGPDTATQQLIGNQTETSGDGGEALTVLTSGSLSVAVRGYSSGFTVAAPTLTAAGISYDQWLFLAVTSRITSGTTTEHRLFVGAGASYLTNTGSGIKTLASDARPLALGREYRAAVAAMQETLYARAFAAPRSMTVAELVAMYRRAKVIAGRRGVVVA